MASPTFEFGPQIPEEYGDWAYWIERARLTEGLSPSGRDTVVAGLDHLRRLLGNDWLKAALAGGHPLFLTLLNAAPMAQMALAGLGHDLVRLAGMTSVNHLVARLKDASEFDGAIAEVSLASKACNAGFTIELPSVKSERVADIRIVEPEVFIEVTALDTSQLQQETVRTARAIFAAAMDSDVISGGRVFHPLPDTLLTNYQRQIRATIDTVKATGQPARLHEDQIIDLRFALRSDEAAIASMRADGYGGLAGPSLQATELYRVRRALEGKLRSFPDVPLGAGVVVLWDSWLPVEAPLKLVAHYFGDLLARYPKVAVAALFYPSMTVGRIGKGTAMVDRRDYGIVIRDIGVPGEEALIVQRATSPLSEDGLIRLFSAAART